MPASDDPRATLVSARTWSAPSARSLVTGYLARAGIVVDGDRPWDIRVHDDRVFRRVLLNGSLAFGETYMEGAWDCDDLSDLIYRILCWRQTEGRWLSHLSLSHAIARVKRRVVNLQSRARATEVVAAHYDLHPALFEAMLGESMTYTCGYWSTATTLDAAQHDKLDLICRKLRLQPGDRVLDLGCGFGAFARHAARLYGATVVGVNLSSVQTAVARRLCAGLPVEFYECDYREIDRYFDGTPFSSVVSIGMFEAVGHRHFRTYMRIVDTVLKDQGLFLLHTIGDDECSADPFSLKYIFPNGELPALDQIVESTRGLLQIQDVHNFGFDYTPTALAWRDRFASRWPEIRAHAPEVFTDRFFRMWMYFLSCAAAAFRAGNMQLWQIVLSKGRLSTPYRSVR
jgi:cyclopropane-fatty-acyl-phospholipid synthase